MINNENRSGTISENNERKISKINIALPENSKRKLRRAALRVMSCWRNKISMKRYMKITMKTQ